MVQYHQYSTTPKSFDETSTVTNLTFYASQLLTQGLENLTELEKALQKALTVLTTATIPVTVHFKTVFICERRAIKKDWLVSELGLRLIILNAAVTNPAVARLQIELLSTHLIIQNQTIDSLN
jgi:hypothetical protein